MVGVDELVRSRWSLGQNAEPCERIDPLVQIERARGNAVAAHPVKSVAARNEVALQKVLGSPGPIPDRRLVRIVVVNGHRVDLEQQRLTRRQSCRHQVSDELLLTVDHHRAAGEVRKVDTVTVPREVKENSVVEQTLAPHALAHARLIEHVDRLMLEDPGPDAALDVLAASGLQHDGFDASQMQEVGEQQSCRSCTDDRNLRAHAYPRVAVRGARL